MPSSSEMFAGEPTAPMFDLNADNKPSMFKTLNNILPEGKPDQVEDMFRLVGGGYPDEPGPYEMEKAKADAARYDRKVYYKGTHVHTFDLSKPEDVKAYSDLRNEMYDRVRKREYEVAFFERRYTTAGGAPRWVVHLEIHEYEFVKTDRMESFPPESGETPHDQREEGGERQAEETPEPEESWEDIADAFVRKEEERGSGGDDGNQPIFEPAPLPDQVQELEDGEQRIL